MHKFQQFCADYNLRYFVTAGTLLGTIRHQGMIPWDNDIDVGMVASQYDILQTLRVPLKQYGIIMKKCKNGLCKIFLKQDGVDQNLWHLLPCIDVFKYVYNKEKDTVVFANPKFRRTWPREWYKLEELRKLQWLKFGPLQVPVPEQYESVCQRLWGPDWRIPRIRPSFKILYPIRTAQMVKEWLNNSR